MKKDKNQLLLEASLKKKANQFSIPLQNVVASNLKKLLKNSIKEKVIEINDFQTSSYPVKSLYKPISRLIDYDNE
ncbi:MAG: hypothetical protein K0B10_14785 [Vicingaceae bacterium]|nr:hypothetical protein [Vicingaceae bacterium]